MVVIELHVLYVKKVSVGKMIKKEILVCKYLQQLVNVISI